MHHCVYVAPISDAKVLATCSINSPEGCVRRHEHNTAQAKQRASSRARKVKDRGGLVIRDRRICVYETHGLSHFVWPL